MTKYLTTLIIILLTIQSCAQVENKQTNSEYRLFRTENMWTFLKLNTRNGKIWQVQFDVKDNNRFVSNLSTEPLVNYDKESNDRFTLYATQNIYTFILLDQIDGRTWQVQWSIDTKNRGIVPIN